MKKLLTSALMTLALVTTISVSRPAQAMVGLFTLNAPMILGGLALSTVGMGVGVASMVKATESASPFYIVGMFGGTIAGFAGGVVFEGEQTIAFAPVTRDEASKIGMTASELESYNSEIDQVNALAAQVDAELNELSKPTLEDSKAIWASLQENVAPETFSAMQKISSQSL